MAKKTNKKTETNTLVNLNTITIKFDIENPRFQGLGYSPYDKAPYGDSIQKMYDSMIETYRKTGSLLLQPIVVEHIDESYYVRAGYTRALTYLCHYDDLCKELEVESLSIPAYVMSNLDIVDSLTENTMRTKQSFVSIAISVKKALDENKLSVKEIAKQLGISDNKVLTYKAIATLPQETLQLCHEGLLTESGAYQLSQKGSIAIERITQYMKDQFVKDDEDEDDDYFSYNQTPESFDADDIDRAFNITLPVIDERCPVFGFVDLSGVYHPPIHEEEWYVETEELFNNKRTLDKEATDMRASRWFNKLIDENNIKVKERWFNTWDYEKVEFGTHPEEIAVWDYSQNYLDFYVKKSEVEKTAGGDDFADAKEKEALKRVDSKITSLKEKARIETVNSEMDKLFTYPVQEFKTLAIEFINLEYPNAATKEAFERFLDGRSMHELDFETIMKYYLAAKACSWASWLPKSVVKFFEDNQIDIKQELDMKYKDIDAMKADMIEKAKEKAEDIKEESSKKITFAQEIYYGIHINHMLPICDTFKLEHEGNLKKFCRLLGIKYKGTENTMKKRLANAYEYIAKSNDISENEMMTDRRDMNMDMVGIIMKYADEVEKIKSTGETIEQDEIFSYFNDCIKELYEKEYVKHDALHVKKWSIKDIISGGAKGKVKQAFVLSLIKNEKVIFTEPFSIAYDDYLTNVINFYSKYPE